MVGAGNFEIPRIGLKGHRSASELHPHKWLEQWVSNPPSARMKGK